MEEGALLQKSFPKEWARVLSCSLHLARSVICTIFSSEKSIFVLTCQTDSPHALGDLVQNPPVLSSSLPLRLARSPLPLFSASNLLHLSLIRAFCPSLFIFYQPPSLSLSLSFCLSRASCQVSSFQQREENTWEEYKQVPTNEPKPERERERPRDSKKGLVSLWAFSRSI